MIIAKFGGTSVSTPESIRTICEIAKKDKPIIVVSALAGVTNLLLDLPTISAKERVRTLDKIRKIHKFFIDPQTLAYVDRQVSQLEKLAKTGKNDKETLDTIASFGEIISSYIITTALNEAGIKAQQILATNLIVTNDSFGAAEFLPKPTERSVKKVIRPLIKDGIVPVITGFIGSTRNGRTTTLGRGGSDYTASIVGFCLSANEIQIWTDVDGIFTADPRIVKNAKLIPTISFKVASELATFGARVLHPRTIKLAIKAGIPVRVLNSFNSKGAGTIIVEKPKLATPVRAVCAKRNITLVNIFSEEMLLQKGFLAQVFAVFAQYGISIDLVGVSEVSVSVTLDNEDHLSEVVEELQSFCLVYVKRQLGIVSIIGERIADSSDFVKEVFTTLNKVRIPVVMVSLGATDINMSLVVVNDRVDDAVRSLHDIIITPL